MLTDATSDCYYVGRRNIGRFEEASRRGLRRRCGGGEYGFAV
jgi:hypothetical protein